MAVDLEALFPGLRGSGYGITSSADDSYNCIGWAANDTLHWWWPDVLQKRYWPAGVAREETVAAFQEAFAALGYTACAGEELEAGLEKVAFFADAQGCPTHAARQLPSGRWTSKLGELQDVEHALRDLEGVEYGTVVLIMMRAVSP